MVPAALIVLEETLQPRLLRLRRPLKLLALAILVLGVLFSFSRAAWLGFAVSVIVFGAVQALRQQAAVRVAIIAAVVLFAGALTAGAVAATGSSDFLQERARVQSYDARRFDAQTAGLDLAVTHPVGIGPGQFEPVVQYATHNTYIRVFSEQGPIGLLVFGSLVLITLWLATRNMTLGRSTYGIGSAALLAAWCGLLVNSLFVDTLHWRHFWLVGALIWAGAMRPAESVIRPSSLEVRSRRRGEAGPLQRSGRDVGAPEDAELAPDQLEPAHEGRGLAGWGPLPGVDEGKVSLNEGSFEELRELGLSITQARRIIQYRERLGGYISVDDLDLVPGFPKDLRARLKQQLRT